MKSDQRLWQMPKLGVWNCTDCMASQAQLVRMRAGQCVKELCR